MQHLQQNSTLQGGKYKIISILGQGGFGITYLAEQVMLERKVALKEFFFREYCDRDKNTSHITLGTQSSAETVQKFLQKFLKEARTISQLEHPNIIKIHDIFEENNTAYYVMDYIEGESLSDIVKREGALPEVTAIEYTKEVASALSYIHSKSINHLDVKPANIMLKKSDNQVVLIDFGLSKQYDEIGSQTSSTPVGISQGYAPIEQYRAGGVSTFSPQTDIYSLGATLYWLVIGKTPPAADEILDEGLPTLPKSISETVKNAITSAMQARKKDRPESVEKWMEILAEKKVPKKKATHKKTKEKTAEPKVESSIADESTMLITPSKPKPTQKKEEVVSTPAFNLVEYQISPALLKDVKETENKANLGNAECMFAVGIMYLRGEGKFQNIDQAYSWLNKCKANGDKRAVDLLERWEELKVSYVQKKKPEAPKVNKPTEVKEEQVKNIKTKSKLSKEYIIAIVIGAVLILGAILSFGDSSKNTEPKPNIDTIKQHSDSVYVEHYEVWDKLGVYYWTGYIKDGLPIGIGKAIYASNDNYGRKEYSGHMSNGTRDGDNATLTYTNGDSYQGSFMYDDFREGTYFSFSTGEKFVGTFVGNQPYNGKWYNKNGQVEGIVKNGN